MTEKKELPENEYEIHSFNWADFQNKIEKINKKARSIGAPEIVVEVLGKRHIPERCKFNCFISTDNWGRGYSEYERPPSPIIPAHDLIHIRLEGEIPYIKGYALHGVIEHSAELNANLVHAVPGQEVPIEYRNRGNVCDHCETKRYRKDTFIIK